MAKKEKQGYQPICKGNQNSVIPPNTGSHIKMKKDGYTYEDIDRSYWEGFDTAKTKMEKHIEEVTKENTELKTKKIPQLERKIASIRGAHSVDCKKLNARLEQVERLKKENALVKSLLYGTQRTCDNCGFVNCENFQRQRKSEPCSLYIPYQVRIKNLAHESDVLRENYNNFVMNLASVSEQLAKAKKIIGNLYAICKDNHYPNSSVLMEQAEQFLNSEVEND